MAAYPRIGNHPEAVVHILLTIIRKISTGGATMEELQEAYREVKDTRPNRRTIYRIINRLNTYFDPLAYGETAGDDEVSDPLDREEEPEPVSKVIRAERRYGKTRYIYCDEFSSPHMEQSDILLTVLSLYPQQRSVLKGCYELVLQRVFKDILAGVSAYSRMLNEIENYVVVSGTVPSDSEKSVRMIKDILQAIRQKNRVRFQYVRTYDGSVVEREVEPYGLLCRLNNWYLTGRCLKRQSDRIYLLLNIRWLRIVEGSSYRMPPGYSLQEAYRDRWGTWTGEEPGEPENVRLKVVRGPAERFRNSRFHDSQRIWELPGGDLEVTFTIKGAREMVPWLMSWGTAVEVLEPRWLKEKLICAHREALQHLT